MLQEYEAGFVAAFEACPYVAAAFSTLGRFIFDTFRFEDVSIEIYCTEFISGRINSVDSDKILEPFYGLIFWCLTVRETPPNHDDE